MGTESLLTRWSRRLALLTPKYHSSYWVNWRISPTISSSSASKHWGVIRERPARVGAVVSSHAVKEKVNLLRSGATVSIPSVAACTGTCAKGVGKAMVLTSPSPPSGRLDRFFLFLGLGGIAGSFVFWALNRDVVEVTGRERTMAIGVEFEKVIGEMMYDHLLEEEPIVEREDPRNVVLQRLFHKILAANGDSVYKSWEWEVTLCEADVVNAFTSLGGKLCFFSGLLHRIGMMNAEGKIDSIQDAVVAVLAHEQGHAIARHVAESMSWLPIQIPFFFISYKSPLMQSVFQYYINLPFSRQNEYEADKIGLSLMARAGFSPDTARDFHLALNESKIYEEFAHTHPVGVNRARQIEDLLPEARKIYLRSSELRNAPVSKQYTNILVKGLSDALDLLEESRHKKSRIPANATKRLFV